MDIWGWLHASKSYDSEFNLYIYFLWKLVKHFETFKIIYLQI